MPTSSWFPTLIYDAKLSPRGDGARRRALLEDAYKIRDYDAPGRKWCARNYAAGYTSYSSMAQLNHGFSTIRDLEKRIDRHVAAFARALEWDLQGGKLVMTDCWVNIMPEHAVHSLHLHPLAVVSGTYYVKTPKGCSRLRFEDPRLSKFMGAPPRREPCRPENRQQVHHPVEAGRVILFESWLRHEVAANVTKAERVSISFNYGWR